MRSCLVINHRSVFVISHLINNLEKRFSDPIMNLKRGGKRNRKNRREIFRIWGSGSYWKQLHSFRNTFIIKFWGVQLPRRDQDQGCCEILLYTEYHSLTVDLKLHVCIKVITCLIHCIKWISFMWKSKDFPWDYAMRSRVFFNLETHWWTEIALDY